MDIGSGLPDPINPRPKHKQIQTCRGCDHDSFDRVWRVKRVGLVSGMVKMCPTRVVHVSGMCPCPTHTWHGHGLGFGVSMLHRSNVLPTITWLLVENKGVHMTTISICAPWTFIFAVSSGRFRFQTIWMVLYWTLTRFARTLGDRSNSWTLLSRLVFCLYLL